MSLFINKRLLAILLHYMNFLIYTILIPPRRKRPRHGSGHGPYGRAPQPVFRGLGRAGHQPAPRELHRRANSIFHRWRPHLSHRAAGQHPQRWRAHHDRPRPPESRRLTERAVARARRRRSTASLDGDARRWPLR